jgi:drug/metabolite transporter, DME family
MTTGRGGGGLVLAGAVLWGTTGTAQALGPASATPLAVGTTRLALGGLLLVAYAALRRRRSRARPIRPASGADRPSTGVRVAAVVGALSVAAYQLTFFAAVDVAGVALGTAVAIGSSPVFTGLIEWVLDRRPPSGRWWAATGVAAAGVALLAGPSRLVPAGVLLALAAGAAYAIYAVAAKRLLDAGMTGPDAMAVVFGGGALLLAPLLAVVPLGWVATARGAGVLAWLAVVTVVLAYQLFAAGLRAVPASTAATLSLAEPLTAALLGLTVLAERPTAVGLTGAALVLLGLLLVAARPAGTVARHVDGNHAGV